MAKLPTDVSGREVVAVLEGIGFVFRRQKGSHMILRREKPYGRAVIPDHKTLRVGTLRQILNDTGLSITEFVRLLRDR